MNAPSALLQKFIPAAALGGQAPRRPLVFTNGVFDVLHTGHVTYLEAARRLGAALVVAVNTDASARRLGKGPDRPLNREADRVAVVAALASVDYVVLFDEDTPCEVLRRLRPDIYVKGGDYDIESLPETELVRSWGGTAVAIPFVEGYSTTALLQRIRAGR
ncbi:MAG TPA: D-glycero-beta-D-manno-heptose 1-phosphate adenylyltransferase [Steroidobacteraceae bacterium]|nr:D-glycero-beta-D-manno-heptose 1-phosphate adenylyltransferase [Steroidobacteraceae bacterium]